jgi:hypothetical protein
VDIFRDVKHTVEIIKSTVKVKVALEQDTKVRRGRRGIALFFL